MAGPIGLTARQLAAPLAVLAAGVVLAHALVLSWLGRALPEPTALKAMADPMFTRMLAPAPAPVIVAAAPAPAPALPAAQRAARPASAASSASARTPPIESAPEVTPAESTVPPDSQAQAIATPAPPEPSFPAASPAPATAAPATDPWPGDTRLTYSLGGQFRGGPLYGGAHVQWQRQGSLYQTRVEINVTLAGTFSMTSQGDVTPQGLVPRTYEEERRGRRRAVRLDENQVVLTDGTALPRPPGVQDAASQFVELGHRFATGQQPLALGGTVDIWLARPAGLDRWTYDVTAQDLLRTPRYGEVMAWRLTPRPISKPRGNITAEMWFAPTLQYLPVRIRLSMGEEALLDLLVDSIEQR